MTKLPKTAKAERLNERAGKDPTRSFLNRLDCFFLVAQRDRDQSTYATSHEAHPIDQLVQNKCAGELFGSLLIGSVSKSS
jgi:hypothetical protein